METTDFTALPPLAQLIIGLLVIVLGPAGAAHMAVKGTLNGMRETVRRTEAKVDTLLDEVPRVRERVSVIEAIVKRGES